jgi:hypothetical protein
MGKLIKATQLIEQAKEIWKTDSIPHEIYIVLHEYCILRELSENSKESETIHTHLTGSKKSYINVR